MHTPNEIFEHRTAALPSLAGKCFAITGTTSGTGYYTCVAAIEKDVGCLLLLNRRSERSEAAAAKLQVLCKGTVLHAIDCDLQSFDSVVKAASEVNSIAAIYGGLDGCVNNAGVMALPDHRTVDGYDVQMQTNHLSHFLLTQLLMPSLDAAAAARGEARIVQHSSGARGKGPALDGVGMLEARFMQPAAEGELGGSALPACYNRYHQTKLANSVCALALHTRLAESGSRVKSVCAEPGVAATDIMINMTQAHQQAGTAPAEGDGASAVSALPGAQSAPDGACPLMEAAFGAGTESGDFYMPGDLIEEIDCFTAFRGAPLKCITAGRPTAFSDLVKETYEDEWLTMNTDNHQLLWDESRRAIGKWFQLAAGAPNS